MRAPPTNRMTFGYRTMYDRIEQRSIDCKPSDWKVTMSQVRAAPAGRGRRRASHSMEALLTEAVALLDAAGEQALTFRALAARLGGGVASIYWYVSSRDELLDRATDYVVDGVLAKIQKIPTTDDPINDLCKIAVMLFDGV